MQTHKYKGEAEIPPGLSFSSFIYTLLVVQLLI